MVSLVHSLEPRQCLPNELILDVQDEVLETLFFTKGSYAIGFNINKQRKFCLQIDTISKGFKTRGNSIGMYNAVFN